MQFNSKVYDILKWCAQILLPGAGTLYFTLCSIWGFPYGEQVIGTLSAIAVFLGVLLGISTAQYKKQGGDTDGTFLIDGNTTQFVFKDELSELSKKDILTIKVEEVQHGQ